MHEDLEGFESCNNEALKRRETLVATLSCINAPDGHMPLAIKGARFHPEDIDESDISWLFCFRMYERELEYLGREYNKVRRANREAGFFAIWSVAEIKEARMNGFISQEQWDRF